jgi:hypothetical protein
MKAPLILIGLVCLALGALFAAIGGRPLLDDWRYRAHGERVEAVVTEKLLRRATTNTDTAYEITVRYSVTGGASYERTERVPVHVWERVERGSSLPVEYARDDPASARVPGPLDRASLALWLGLGGALICGGVLAFRAAFRRYPLADAESLTPDSPAVVAIAAEPSFWPLARRSFGFWTGAMCLLIALPLAGASILTHYADWSFGREATFTDGTVLTKEIRKSRRRGKTRVRGYEATYRFAVDGRVYEGRDQLSLDGWRALHEQERTRVRYRPRDPSDNRLDAPRPWLRRTVMLLSGILLSGIGGFLFAGAVRRARLEWRLSPHGARTEGTVTARFDRNLVVDGVRLWRLQYEFSDDQGVRHENTTDMPETDAAGWNVGESGVVLYDPARPDEAIWIGREPR